MRLPGQDAVAPPREICAAGALAFVKTKRRKKTRRRRVLITRSALQQHRPCRHPVSLVAPFRCDAERLPTQKGSQQARECRHALRQRPLDSLRPPQRLRRCLCRRLMGHNWCLAAELMQCERGRRSGRSASPPAMRRHAWQTLRMKKRTLLPDEDRTCPRRRRRRRRVLATLDVDSCSSTAPLPYFLAYRFHSRLLRAAQRRFEQHQQTHLPRQVPSRSAGPQIESMQQASKDTPEVATALPLLNAFSDPTDSRWRPT